MRVAIVLAALSAFALSGCQSSPPPAASAPQSSPASQAAPTAPAPPPSAPAAAPAPAASAKADAFQQKLKDTAGSGATDCGRVQFQGAPDAVRKASNCAMEAAQAKRAFLVAYEMPGLAVGTVGDAKGKLYSVQAQGEAGKAANVSSTPCTAPLRVADSGRVTCMPRASMGTAGGPNPHGGGMTMPPTGASPHGTMTMPPAGTGNPHGGEMLLPRTGKSGSSGQSSDKSK